MRAKRIHESLGDLLAGKSDEQIRKDLNFQRQSRSVERFSRVLNNKLTDSIGNFYEVVLVLEHDWWLWFYKYDKYSKKWVVDQLLTVDQVRSIIEMRAKLKKFNTFPNSRNNDLIGMNNLMMEVGKTIQNYHKEKKKISESLGNILRPKNKEDVYAEFQKHGITGEKISIRIRRPEADYNWLRLNRCLLKTDTEMSEYHGPVPEEEHEEYFLKISGKPWNVLRFNQIYFGYGPLPTYLEIETLKQRIINESLNEGLLSNVNLEKIKPHLIKTIYDISSDMVVTAYQIEQNKEDEDFDEIIESEDFKLWLDYESEVLLSKAAERLEEVIDWNGNITIWRKIRVDDNWFKHLITQGNRLGIYWSWDEHAAEAHWGYNIKDKYNNVLIKSSINEKYVDWEKTLVLNAELSSEEEKEIRLFKNTPLKIEGLWINNEEIDITPIKNKVFKA